MCSRRRRQAKDEIGRNQSPDNRTKRFRRPVVDEACESTPGLPAKQRRAVGKPVFEIARDVPGIVNDPVAAAEDRHHVLTTQGSDRLDIGEADETEFD